jgi:hypothetical protein
MVSAADRHDRSRFYGPKPLLSYIHEAEWTPLQTHCFSETLVALGLEPRTSATVVRKSDHWTTEAAQELSFHAEKKKHFLLDGTLHQSSQFLCMYLNCLPFRDYFH